MEVFVVIDMVGCGRVVGVFDSEAKAQDVVGVEPAYYELHRVRLNELNVVALEWATSDAHRQRLEQLLCE